MLENLFFYSGFLGIFAMFPLMERYKKITYPLFVVAMFALLYEFFIGYSEQIFDSFSFFWMRTQKYRLEINIDSSEKNYIRLLPVLIMSFLTSLYGTFAFKDRNDKNFYALIAFNIANMIVLVSSRNLVQLLTCICMADIITQAMIRNFGASKKYIFYSLFADFGLLMIFAMVQGKLKSFDLDGFVAYKKIGRHKDFVAIASLLFILAKMGFFLFQASLLDLKNVKKYKIISVISFGGILSTFFALVKIYPLLQIYKYSNYFLSANIVFSAVWGFVCGIIMAGANRQIIYFNMLLHACAIYLFMKNGVYNNEISAFLLCGYLTSVALCFNKKFAKIASRIVVSALWGGILYYYRGYNDWKLCVFVGAILIFIALSGNLTWFYNNKKLQKADGFSRVYDIIFVKPILILGRGLWLLVDFMIMEKHVVGSVEAAGDISSGYIEKIKNCSLMMKILWFLLVISLFVVSCYFEGVRQ